MIASRDDLDQLEQIVQSEILSRTGDADQLNIIGVWVDAWREAIQSDMQADLEPINGTDWRAAVSKIALSDASLRTRVAVLARLERYVAAQKTNTP